MELFHQFQKQILFNYIIGSIIAIFGVGSVFIFHTLNLTTNEVLYLLMVMIFSGTVMVGLEIRSYKTHIQPLKRYFYTEAPTDQQVNEAFLTAHRFPLLTLQRILGPHLLGLSIPASIVTFGLIYHNFISLPYYYIFYAWCGAILIAVMHGLIEFYLTTSAVKAVIQSISNRARVPLSIEGKFFLSIQQKLLMSSLLIAVFPVCLFLLAAQIRTTDGGTSTYWSWASVIVGVILFLSIYGTLLLYKSIEQPINELRENLLKVKQGQLETMDNYYSDEFSNLVSGFNLMVSGIKERDKENEQLLESFFTVFAATLDARDSYTAGHTNRVADYSVEIARKANFSIEQIDLLRKAALLHDIGKIGVRDEVLLKDGKLTDEEFDQIKLHPTIGANILEQVGLPKHLLAIVPGVKYHHERYDGNGYPEGLKGEEIPLLGRLIAVADAFDAMTSDRPYRKGMPIAKALQILEEGKGTQWDPYFASILIELQKEM
ncbi:HD domain-containing phosphohydrolase [Anaerobacillus alkaliphilus]|uniref:HD domain-containing phosphohydrolase n=1 Tax=Anaerobacillus alkaliphilus TaxID=1548597 RepID=UPI0026B0F44F